MSLLAAWDTLPASVRARLALAGTGWRHLALAGADCLRAARDTGDPALLRTAAHVLLWAWGEAPLHGPLAAEILSAADHPAGLPLPPAARAGLAAVAGLWRAPEAGDGGTAYFERLAARRDTARLAEFLAGQIAKDALAGGAALFWREKALALALFSGEGDMSRALHSAALKGLGDGLERAPGLAPVAANLRAQAAFLAGDAEACLAALSGLDADGESPFGPAFAPARAGLALLAAGDEPRALPRLFTALAAAPWQAALAQAAADAASGARREVAPPPGPVAVLLYSWNKADDLDATLASLLASELHGARIIALDNGSTDRTDQVLEGWRARLGGMLETIALPVNIGAAAARNWLAATDAARASETMVYLDDDVELPADWLGRLGAAMRRLPGAGVWGCKVADHAAPRLLQNVAGMLTFPQEAPQGPDPDFQSLSPNPFRLLDAHLQGPDWGLFDFLAPCSSVTGCCHAFRRSWLDLPQKDGGAAGGGGFSLALMPSQYDDFERDLRMLDGGGHAAYTGHLRVRHRKRSGIAAQRDEAGAGALGNRYKMQCMHHRASIARHIQEQDRRAQEHVRAALAQLDQTGEPT